jgi:hypothetical protein
MWNIDLRGANIGEGEDKRRKLKKVNMVDVLSIQE